MRILVTGGAGFIGSHTVEALVREGVGDVAVVDNLSSGRREQLNSAARLHKVDLRDAGAVAAVIEREKPSVIFHFAAQMDVRRSVADPVLDAEVNIVGFLGLIETARRRGLKRIIFASTGGAIYGEQDQLPTGEDCPPQPVSPYGVAKLATENYLYFYRVQYGVDYLALRYANVYGPRQDPHGEAGVVAIFCHRILDGRPVTIYGDGEQTRDYVHVKDVVRANLMAFSSPVSGALNIGTGIETSVNRLYDELQQRAGVSRPAEYAPARPGEQRRSAISPARAAATLGWSPAVTLSDGLGETFEYFARERAQRAK
jgi:UDP-glucose 4-epimerase